MESQVPLYGVAIAVTVLAGFVRGASGFGGPMILVPTLQLVFGPKSGVLITLIIDLLANVRLVPDAKRDASPAILKPMLLGALIGLPGGIIFLAWTEPTLARRIISAILLLCVVLVLIGWRWPRAMDRKELAAAGALGGLSLGASGVCVIVNIALQAGHHSAVASRANFIVWAFAATIVAIAALFATGALNATGLPAPRQLLVLTVIFAPAYLLGIVSGVYLYRRINERLLRLSTLWFAAIVAAIGLVV